MKLISRELTPRRLPGCIEIAGLALLLTASSVQAEAPHFQLRPFAPGGIAIDWEHPSDGARGIIVEREDPAFSWEFTALVNSFNDLGLQPSRLYRYRVCAQYGQALDCADWSGVQTLATPPPYSRPARPTFNSSSATANSITVTWTSSSSYGFYQVRWAEDGHRDRQNEVTGKSFTASRLRPGNYHFIVQGCNTTLLGSSCGGWTAPIGVSTRAPLPAAPPPPPPEIASRNSCASTVVKQTASVAWGWNDGSGKTSFALFPSAGTKFLDRAAVSVREGGWADDVKWFAGDFDNDGTTDIGAAWNNGGSNTLTVRQVTGSRISATHWATNAGGWSPTAVWLPGDFNGDGRTDVAGVWNDGGQVSVAVYVSDGKKFLYPTQWSVRDGGWGDTVKWFAGDFNGDGKADIGAAWNNNGATTLTVRQSSGSGFVPAHWSANAGSWSDTSAFVAGDFNGDSRTDVARLWNDAGQNSTSVSLSAGTSFSGPAAWSVRDGGWIGGDAVKWFPGDFNGDGRTDIGVAWDDNHLNTLTVRQSTGSGFVPAHWATRAGGWRNSATWCTGQFKPTGPTGATTETRADNELSPRVSDTTPIKPQGRVKLEPGTAADRRPLSICDSWRAARARNSPAAPGLEAQCKAQGEQAPIDFDGLAIKGEAISSQDPLSVDLRNQQPEGPIRLGFDIGMGVAEGQTAPGPGKQAIQNRLSPLEQRGFVFALAFSLDRNRNPELARIGAAVAAADPDTAAARAAQPDVLHRLGFDLATGLFGNPALGAHGNTATGPGSMAIRNALSPSAQSGFDNGVAFHLRRK